ncbi:hypothetical protein SOPP22_13320 [Shewanella sp. OPT22]|nr:hypothetical protein SOPP22_13320 [Shewanella sp. OPT22]
MMSFVMMQVKMSQMILVAVFITYYTILVGFLFARLNRLESKGECGFTCDLDQKKAVDLTVKIVLLTVSPFDLNLE